MVGLFAAHARSLLDFFLLTALIILHPEQLFMCVGTCVISFLILQKTTPYHTNSQDVMKVFSHLPVAGGPPVTMTIGAGAGRGRAGVAGNPLTMIGGSRYRALDESFTKSVIEIVQKASCMDLVRKGVSLGEMKGNELKANGAVVGFIEKSKAMARHGKAGQSRVSQSLLTMDDIMTPSAHTSNESTVSYIGTTKDVLNQHALVCDRWFANSVRCFNNQFKPHLFQPFNHSLYMELVRKNPLISTLIKCPPV
ncbi:MAG: hypothetical protein J3R72DRAFT_435065 [Linnemannia gamsii]|nr:MAG: hypothetical protein J3R72DRAFT_435065 [Linnemannia gamsii]